MSGDQPPLYSDNFLLFIVVIVALVAASIVAVVAYLGKCGVALLWAS